MRLTRTTMGMPATVEIAGDGADDAAFEAVFDLYASIDARFSTYKPDSEISRLNDGRLTATDCSDEMKTVLRLCEETKRLTGGYFDVRGRDGRIDPSGLVKGWAIFRAAELLRGRGFKDFFVEIAGDVQTCGLSADGRPWRVGIRDPFNGAEVVKVLAASDCGIATSGTAERGQHVYDPHAPHSPLTDIVSLTVIGPNVYEADRFATAAFAMGRKGIGFVAGLDGFEGYMIDRHGMATFTPGLEKYVLAYV